MSASHRLPDKFMQDLRSGILNPLLQEIRADDTLLMGLRGSYISIYYRGGQLLKIEAGNDGYKVIFDQRYDPSDVLAGRLARHGCEDVLKRRLRSIDDVVTLVEILSELKRLMDRHKKVQTGLEREFQQVAARVNSRSKSSNSSHYFITDIEHKYGEARYDMLGVRWRRNIEHRDHKCLVPVLFEMKYGLDSLDGGSGMVEHLSTTLRHLKDEHFRSALASNLKAQFNQLSTLELLRYERGSSLEEFSPVDNHFQIVFVLAEYVPHSEKLTGILKRCDDLMAESARDFESAGLQVDLRFASASLCGYAMHERTMLTTDQVRTLLDAWNA